MTRKNRMKAGTAAMLTEEAGGNMKESYEEAGTMEMVAYYGNSEASVNIATETGIMPGIKEELYLALSARNIVNMAEESVEVEADKTILTKEIGGQEWKGKHFSLEVNGQALQEESM